MSGMLIGPGARLAVIDVDEVDEVLVCAILVFVEVYAALKTVSRARFAQNGRTRGCTVGSAVEPRWLTA